MRILIVDPSSRGGIALYTALVSRALVACGARPTVVANRRLARTDQEYEVIRALPNQEWGRRHAAGAGFYVGRAAAWGASAAAIAATALRRRPQVIHFQAAINRRFDARLVRVLRRVAPVVWTAHDVLPFDRTPEDAGRFAAIYRAADLVLVHGEAAADEVRALAGVEATVVRHVPSELVVEPVGRSEARRQLGLPEEGRILGALGFIRRYKGYSLLAEAWELLGDQAPLVLVLGDVMDEDQRPTLERLEATGRAVVRLGYVSDEELQLAVLASDAVVLPYTESSESGLLHQAHALGVPVLASDAPQLAASVEAMAAGRVVPADAASWAAAVVGELPDTPAEGPPTAAEVGREHLDVYELARSRASGGR